MVDGKRLGTIYDVEIDMASGKVIALVVPGEARFLGIFGREEEHVIPWDRIRKVGTDVILVEITPATDLATPGG